MQQKVLPRGAVVVKCSNDAVLRSADRARRGRGILFLAGSVQPTPTIRPGVAVRVMVANDLLLRPYQPLFFMRGALQ